MRSRLVGLFALAVLVTGTLCSIHLVEAQPPGGGPGGPGGPPPPGGRGMMGAPVDSFVAERDSLMNDLLRHYAGRESAPAESVFKNLKVIKGRTVEQVLRMMNMGFGRNLGVACQHCHVLGHWADEDKPTKQVTRDMMAMVGRINGELLPAIKNLKSEQPGVNCGTCHRGTARPGTGPMAGGGAGGGGPRR
jgi:hypothetical protein